MSGVAIIRALLCSNNNIITVIPETRIIAGALPLKTVIPAISITTISTIEHGTVTANDESNFATDRIQVTVYAKTYTLQKAYLKLLRSILKNANGEIGGVLCDSVLYESDGADIYDETLILYEQSQDYMVSYHR